jgi:ABC-type branched-subunit amino acid transport system ATPase component
MLKLENVVAGYGGKTVLNGVSLEINVSEICGLVGPNGSGKSTILKSIFGLVRVSSGKINYRDDPIQNRKSSLNVQDGISYIPQGGRVFSKLTVQENLEMGGVLIKDRKRLKERVDRLYERFPRLKDYRNIPAGNLSGGERQMVGFSIGLVMGPDFLLIDEPSIGLAPRLVGRTMDLIREIREKFNTAVLMVEQNVRALLAVAERVYLLRNGEIVYQEDAIDKETESRLRKRFLG